MSWTQEAVDRFTRPVSGLAGMAGIFNSESGQVDWQVANLHGDVVATIQADDEGLSRTSEATEYGTPRNTDDLGTQRYGWLGAKQRAADAPSGIVLMGVRLYNPTTGRFLQTDPIYGGNANPYDYCSGDPVNCFDLDGKWSFSKWRKKAWQSTKRWWRSNGKWVVGGALALGGAAACLASAGVACAIIVGAVVGGAGYGYNCYHDSGYRWSRRCSGQAAKGAAYGALTGGAGKYLKLRYAGRNVKASHCGHGRGGYSRSGSHRERGWRQWASRWW